MKAMAEIEGLLGNTLLGFFSLEQEEHYGSVRMLGDLLIANSRPLELCNHGEKFSKVLVSYADSLYFDLQFRRALHFYKEAFSVSQTRQDQTNKCGPSECETKWKMYKCHMKLKEKQEALDILVSIPLKQRDSKVALALGKLYHNFKQETREAKTYYKLALSMSPFALEAAVGLLSLGVGLLDVLYTARSSQCKDKLPVLAPGTWLHSWLEVQAHIGRHDYNGAVSKMNFITQQGFVASAEMNCQLGWCMSRLGQTDTAKEAFAIAHAQDPYTLTHMDTYSRLLNHSSLLRLTPRLLYASPHHHQPWISKAWESVRRGNDCLQNFSIFLQKAKTIEPRNAEMTFVQGYILAARGEPESLVHIKEAIHIDPTFFEAYERLTEIYRDRSQGGLALTFIRKQAKKLPNYQLHYLEGLALIQQSPARAKLAFERCIKLKPMFEKAVIELAKLHLSEKNSAQVIEILTRQLEMQRSAALHCELGECLVKLNTLPEAEEQFRLALGCEPESERAQKTFLQSVNILQDSQLFQTLVMENTGSKHMFV